MIRTALEIHNLTHNIKTRRDEAGLRGCLIASATEEVQGVVLGTRLNNDGTFIIEIALETDTAFYDERTFEAAYIFFIPRDDSKKMPEHYVACPKEFKNSFIDELNKMNRTFINFGAPIRKTD